MPKTVPKSKQNEKDNAIQFDDNDVVAIIHGINYTALDYKNKFTGIDLILKPNKECKTTKVNSNEKVKKINRYGFEETKTTIPHKANGGNARIIPDNHIAIKVNGRGGVFTVNAVCITKDPADNIKTLIPVPEIKHYEKYSNDMKYNVIRYLGKSSSEPKLCKMTDKQLTRLRGMLKDLRNLEIAYEKSGSKEDKELLDGYNQTIMDSFGFSNRGILTDIRLWIWLLSDMHEYLFTEKSIEDATFVIPDILFYKFEPAMYRDKG